MHHFCQNLPIILVGCKKDLRQDPRTIEELKKTSQRPVSQQEGQAVASKIGAKRYIECSARTGEGVRDVFQTATREALVRLRLSLSLCLSLHLCCFLVG